MAARKTYTKTAEKPKTKKGKCIDCLHGYVMKDDMPCNPLVTLCQTNNERYPQSWECQINNFEPRAGEMEIHEMIHLIRKDDGNTEICTE